MRNVVLIMTASIDGFVVGPKGHAGGMPEPDRTRSSGNSIGSMRRHAHHGSRDVRGDGRVLAYLY